MGGASSHSDRSWQLLAFVFSACLLLTNPWSAAAQDDDAPLRVGVLAHFPPHYLTNQQTGAPDGYAVDIMAAIAEQMGADIDYVVFETWPALQQALRDQAVDVIPNIGITPDRKEWADFTAPVETIPVSLFVRSATDDIRRVDDLRDHRVSVVRTNVGVLLMEERQHGDLVIHETLDEALLTLLSGHSKALIYPQHVLALLARESGLEEHIEVVGEPLLEIKRAIAVSKGNEALLARLNQAVGDVVRSDAYGEIFAKWYGTPKPFWNIRKVLMAMGTLMVLAIIVVVAWRYRSMVALNKQLEASISEKEQAQRALRQSEMRFRDFADSASDWLWETGPDHRFSYVSPRLTQVSGLRTEDYIGRPRTEVPGNLEDSANWQQHRQDLEARRPFRDFTYARQLSDDQACHFKTSGKPIFDDGGEFLGYRGTGSDITAEVERMARERETEMRLVRAIEAVPAAFALFDADDRLIMCNNKQREFYETDPVSLVPGTCFQDLAHAIAKHGDIGYSRDDAETWLARRLDRRNNPAEGYTFKHGADRWVSITDHFLADGSSITLGVDVTDLKRSEEALREREERLRSILETAPDAIITIDDHGLISSFSPYAEKMFGYIAEEVVGQNVKTLMPSPYRQEHDGYLAHYRDTGERKIIGVGREVAAQRKDGSVFPMFLMVNEMVIEGRRMFTGVLRDMTEEKARDAQLRQAQKMEAVGQLTGGVAHDFNNLLTAIMGNLEMLEMRLGDDDKSHVMIEAAQEAAGLGAELTGRLLAFARRQPLDPKVIALNDIVLDMRDLLERTLGETIEINTVLANPLDETLADPAQVQNALLNLAINARDAMPGGGQLTIETANVELDQAYVHDHADLSAGNYVLLSVSDTGTGMTPETRDRVFEPFFTTKEVGKGSGMGLSMVYGFIKQSGGHVLLYSEVDHGTTISLYLPKAAACGEAEAQQSKAVMEMPRSRRETVLVVEDDPRVMQVTIQRLESLGYIVLEAEHAQAALDLLKTSPSVDLVFTDVVMPGGMSGTELAQEVQRLHPTTKILLTSGYSEHTGIENGMAEESVLWLRKPYRLAELAQKVRDVLDR